MHWRGSWKAAVSILVLPLHAQGERHPTRLLADLRNAASRDAAVDALIELQGAAVAGVVADLAELDRPDAAPEVATALLTVLGTAGERAATAGPVRLEVLARTRRADLYSLTWWALGETQRGRSFLPDDLWQKAMRRADAITKAIADAKVTLARKVAEDKVALYRALRADEANDGLAWTRAPAAAALVAEAAGGAPDLAASLAAHFDDLFAWRRSLEDWNVWCLAEIAAGMRRLALAPDDELRVEVARLSHPIARERRLAAEGLRRFGHFTVPFLGDLWARTDDSEPAVVRAALATLGDLGLPALVLRPALQALTRSDDPDRAGAAVAALAHVDATLSRAPERVAAAVAFATADGAARAARKATVRATPDVAVVLLATLATSTHEALQLDILDLLRAEPGGVERVTTLVELVPNATPDVAAAIWSALASVGSAAASIKDLRRRIECATAAAPAPSLSAMSETLATLLVRPDRPADLRALLSDPNPILRLRATEALGRAPELDPMTLDALADATTAEHPQEVRLVHGVRQTTAKVELVLDAASIRVAAARVLLTRAPTGSRQRAAMSVALASDDRAARLDALGCAASEPLPDAALPLAIDCLRSSDDAVALAAVVALGRCGRAAAEALPQLDALALGDGALAAAARAARAAITSR